SVPIKLPGETHDRTHRQWKSAEGGRRSGHAAALCAPQRSADERCQVRLRRRPMRCLHRDGRRRGAFLLPAPDFRTAGPSDQDGRGHRHGREARAAATGLHRRAGGAMRLLHRRRDDARAGAAGEEPRRLGSGDPRHAVAQPLPLRHPRTDRARGTPCRCGHAHCQFRPSNQGSRPMNAPLSLDISRRSLLAGGGALIVSFSLPGAGKVAAQEAEATGGGIPSDMLDSWLRIDAQGVATVYTGRAEFGQGMKTAMIQLAAEELNLDPHTVRIIACDTALTPNEGYTSGSRGMADGGTTVRAAAAQMRQVLVNAAASKLGADAAQLKLENGKVVAPD